MRRLVLLLHHVDVMRQSPFILFVIAATITLLKPGSTCYLQLVPVRWLVRRVPVGVPGTVRKEAGVGFNSPSKAHL